MNDSTPTRVRSWMRSSMLSTLHPSPPTAGHSAEGAMNHSTPHCTCKPWNNRRQQQSGVSLGQSGSIQCSPASAAKVLACQRRQSARLPAAHAMLACQRRQNTPSGHLQIIPHVYADVCGRMLTYTDVCRDRRHARQRRRWPWPRRRQGGQS